MYNICTYDNPSANLPPIVFFARFCDTFREPSATQDFILPPSFRDQPFQYFRQLPNKKTFRKTFRGQFKGKPSAELSASFREPAQGYSAVENGGGGGGGSTRGIVYIIL